MDTTEYEQRQTKLQATTRDWILRGEPNAIVTFTFKPEAKVSYRSAEKIFGIFAHELKCKLFGRKSKKRILMIPVIEGYAAEVLQHSTSSSPIETHIHCLFRFPENPMSYMGMVRQSWVTASGKCGDPHIYCPDGEKWFLELDGGEKQRKYTNYVLKTCLHDSKAVLWDFVPTGHLT